MGGIHPFNVVIRVEFLIFLEFPPLLKGTFKGHVNLENLCVSLPPPPSFKSRVLTLLILPKRLWRFSQFIDISYLRIYFCIFKKHVNNETYNIIILYKKPMDSFNIEQGTLV